MATGDHQTLTKVLAGSLTENKQHGLRYTFITDDQFVSYHLICAFHSVPFSISIVFLNVDLSRSKTNAYFCECHFGYHIKSYH